MSTNPALIVVVVVLIAAVIVLAVLLYNQRRRSRHLQAHFGPEYTRLAKSDGQQAAERELEAREKRVARFDVKPLPEESKQRFSNRWQKVQSEFVDDPKRSL